MSTVVYYPDKFTIDDTKYAKTGSNVFTDSQVVSGNITLANSSNRFFGTASYAITAGSANAVSVATIPQILSGTHPQYGLKINQSGSGNALIVQNENDSVNSKVLYVTNSGSVAIGKNQSTLPYISNPNYILDVAGHTALSGNLLTTGSVTIKGNISVEQNLSVTGNLITQQNLTVSGNVILGDASGDILTLNGQNVSIPNNLNIDSNTLFINASSNRVGIGTTTPASELDINGILSISGSGIITNQSTFNIVTSSVSTLNIGNSSTSINIGSATGGTIINNSLTASNISSSVRIQSTSITGSNANLSVITASNLSASTQITSKKLIINTTATTYDINTAGTFSHNGNFVPSTSNIWDLGSNSAVWKQLNVTSVTGSVISASAMQILPSIVSASQNIEFASGKGLRFAGKNRGNVLDDYEIGDWTPATPGNFNFSSPYGRYVKIGRLVTLVGSFVITSAADGAFDFFSGLPFTPIENSTISFSYADVGTLGSPLQITIGNGLISSNGYIWVPPLSNGKTVTFSANYRAI